MALAISFKSPPSGDLRIKRFSLPYDDVAIDEDFATDPFIFVSTRETNAAYSSNLDVVWEAHFPDVYYFTVLQFVENIFYLPPCDSERVSGSLVAAASWLLIFRSSIINFAFLKSWLSSSPDRPVFPHRSAQRRWSWAASSSKHS